MTFEQLEIAMEERGYNLNAILPEEVEAIAAAEGFKFDAKRERYYYTA